MKWTTSSGKTVMCVGDRVQIVDPCRTPPMREVHTAEAFVQPRSLLVRDMHVLADLLGTLARMLTSDDLQHPLARKRLAFWRTIQPSIARDVSLAFVESYRSRVCDVRLDIAGLVVTRVSDDTMGYARQMLLDEAFFYGPRAFGLGEELRARLCDIVLEALPAAAGITRDDAFPLVDHRALTMRSWCFDERADGESYVLVDGHSVVAGYQYQRDMGSSRYPVERVLTKAENIDLRAPKSIQDEVHAYLRLAIQR